MNSQFNEINNLPYNDIFYPLLKAFHKSLSYCYYLYLNKQFLSCTDKEISSFFEEALDLPFYRNTGLDSHIVKGLTLSHKKREKENVFPRLTKLVINSFEQAQESKSPERYTGIIIPSPLSVLYSSLTVPEEPQTASYAYVTCRGMLFNYLKLHPKTPSLNKIAPHLDAITEEDVLNSILSFKNYNKQYGRWPDERSNVQNLSSRVNLLCGHILSLKRYTYLWFKTETQLTNFLGYEYIGGQLKEVKKFEPWINYSNKFDNDQKYYFRQSGYYNDLPEISEIDNWIFGVPIPWRGADLLFFDGLKKSSSGGLVMSLYGEPGAGKTSAALSLSACMAPYQTNTIYITLEENPDDLKIRLRSLIPAYLRKTSIYQAYNRASRSGKEEIPWFEAVPYKEKATHQKVIGILKALKEKINNSYKESREKLNSDNIIPATCPLLVIIDNINELFDKDVSYQDTEEFIDYCRGIGAFVILIAADEIPHKQKLDYLVDVAVRLKQEGVNHKYDKPIRIIQLLKTRFQVSRQGSHVFHLSSSGGFRISPQVPSQMDKREKIKIQLPSRTLFIHTLNLYSVKNKLEFKNTLSIAAHSQILVHGQGSTGKAGFGMKILLTPLSGQRILNRNLDNINIPQNAYNKTLIISFLYPKEYYDVLKRRIDNQFESNLSGFNPLNSQIVVKAFYPGYLTPEDFVNKVFRLLEHARLEGEPFTGVMFDGLHNVFLQFKNLQKAHMIWPLLYSMLYRYSITVVTTFTNFSIEEQESSHSSSVVTIPQDYLMMQQGQKPFLHGLVKAADYFFVLDEKIQATNDFPEKEYILRIRSSIRQTPPTLRLHWDRENLTLCEKIVNG